MGTVKAENYPDNGKCVSGYCTKINDKQNITLLHERIQDIGGGGHVLTSGLSVGDKWPKILSNNGGLGGRGHVGVEIRKFHLVSTKNTSLDITFVS